MYLKFFSRKQSPKTSFLSLVITEGTVSAALWNASSNGIAVEKISTPVPWQEAAAEGLIEASDVALEQLGTSANRVREVLLGLPNDWAVEQSLSAAKKPLLKNVTEKLNLKSVGFVVTTEAIIAHIRDSQGSRASGVVCFVEDKHTVVTAFEKGSILGSVRVARSSSIANDLKEGIARGKFSHLPGRIIVASCDVAAQQIEAALSELSSVQWPDGVFAHHPKAEYMSIQQIVAAVCQTGGREVARSLGIMEGDAPVPEPEEQEEQQEGEFGFQPIAHEEEERAPEVEPDEKVDLGVDEPVKRKFKLPAFKGIAVKVGIALLILFLLSGVGVMALTRNARAQVDILIRSQPVDFETTLTIDPEASESDPSQHILKGSIKERELEDTLEGATTGSKTIGDKAKGSLTIYNRTTAEKVFAAGTQLRYSQTIAYTLDKELTVPAGDSGNEYVGKASVTVTADQIGAESNVDKGVELTVASFDKSAYVGKTDDKLIGGTSRVIQVVSETDQKQLADSLYAKLKDQAKNVFSQEKEANEHVIVLDTATVVSKNYNQDIGQEARTVTLTMSVKAKGVLYTNEELTKFVSAELPTQIAPGATLRADKTDITILEQLPSEDEKQIIKAKITSEAIPPFDETNMAQLLAGKKIGDAEAFLRSQESISDFDIRLSPSFVKAFVSDIPGDINRIEVNATVL